MDSIATASSRWMRRMGGSLEHVETGRTDRSIAVPPT
jgi:hypothetical protein